MPRRALPRRLGSDQTVELADHLGELRQRLVLCLVAYVPASVLAFAFHERIVELLAGLAARREAARHARRNRAVHDLGEGQPGGGPRADAAARPEPVWAFFAPALTPSTQRAIGGLVVLATALFGVGVAFAYAVVLPRALTFLLGFDEQLYEIQVRASYYYAFAAMTLLASGPPSSS